VVGVEVPIGFISWLGYVTVRRFKHPEWVAAIYMTMIASCFAFNLMYFLTSAYSSIHAWFPLLSFAAILLCGRWLGMLAVLAIFIESILVIALTRDYGFVLMAGLNFDLSVTTILGTLVSGFVASFAIMTSVEISRQGADSANKTATALSLQRASLSLLGDMARDIIRNMKGPLSGMQKKMDEVLQWDAHDTLHNRGPQIMQSLQQGLTELERLTESLLLFSQTHGGQEMASLRAVDFLNHLNELTREKAIARGVSLDFTADQPQVRLHVRVAAALFALVSLVNKGVEATAGQEPAWVRLQLRVYGRQMQIRVLDSGPCLSYHERRAIQVQASQRSAWDVNLRLSLDFLDSIGGQMTLDPYSPDTCYLISIPLTEAPSQTNRAA
jgi:signal transduction histidine kinase